VLCFWCQNTPRTSPICLIRGLIHGKRLCVAAFQSSMRTIAETDFYFSYTCTVLVESCGTLWFFEALTATKSSTVIFLHQASSLATFVAD
jgi:hypothetical protein